MFVRLGGGFSGDYGGDFVTAVSISVCYKFVLGFNIFRSKWWDLVIVGMMGEVCCKQFASHW